MNPFKVPRPKPPGTEPNRLSDYPSPSDWGIHSIPPVSVATHKPEPLGLYGLSQAQQLVVGWGGHEINSNQLGFFPSVKGFHSSVPSKARASAPSATLQHAGLLEQHNAAIYNTPSTIESQTETPPTMFFHITPHTKFHTPLTEPLTASPSQAVEPIDHHSEEELSLYARDEQNESTKAFLSSEASMCSSVMGTTGDQTQLELRRTRESTKDYLSNLSTAQLSRARDQSDTNRPAMFQDLSKELPVEYSGQSGENGGTDDEFESYRDECQSIMGNAGSGPNSSGATQETHIGLVSDNKEISSPTELYQKYMGNCSGISSSRLVSMSMIIRSQMLRSKEGDISNSNTANEHHTLSDDDASTMTYHPPTMLSTQKKKALGAPKVRRDSKNPEHNPSLRYMIRLTRKGGGGKLVYSLRDKTSAKPLNSYILFCTDWREIYQKENPTLSTRQLASVLGIVWRGLSDEEKNEYAQKAENIKTEGMKTPGNGAPPKQSPLPSAHRGSDRKKGAEFKGNPVNPMHHRDGPMVVNEITADHFSRGFATSKAEALTPSFTNFVCVTKEEIQEKRERDREKRKQQNQQRELSKLVRESKPSEGPTKGAQTTKGSD